MFFWASPNVFPNVLLFISLITWQNKNIWQVFFLYLTEHHNSVFLKVIFQEGPVSVLCVGKKVLMGLW
jgi:hypothetical protein